MVSLSNLTPPCSCRDSTAIGATAVHDPAEVLSF
jgi:hypothetical protein